MVDFSKIDLSTYTQNIKMPNVKTEGGSSSDSPNSIHTVAPSYTSSSAGIDSNAGGTIRLNSGIGTKEITKSGNTTIETVKDENGNVLEKTETTIEGNGKTTIIKYEGERQVSKTVMDPTTGDTTIEKDGKKTTETADGTKIVEENGVKTTTTQDGTEIVEKDGEKVTTFPDGSKETVITDGNKTTTTKSDGTEIVEEDGKKITTFPDGSTETVITVGDKTTTTTIKDGKETVKTEENGKLVSQTITKDGTTSTVEYDNGNTKGVVVQNGESPAEIAKKFGCDVQALLDANPDAVKGDASNQYFLVGADIVIPGQMDASKFAELNAGRKSKVENVQAYNDAMEAKKAEADAKAKAEADANVKQTVINENPQEDSSELNPEIEKGLSITNKDVSYAKFKNGEIVFYGKDGKPLTKEETNALIKQEGEAVFNNIKSATFCAGTKEQLLSNSIKTIYSPEILDIVNDKLEESGRKGGELETPLESLLLSELSHQEARSEIKTLINNGAYGDKTSTDEAMVRNATREIEYEINGWTDVSDLKDAMDIVSNSPEARRVLENEIHERHPNIKTDNGSYVRGMIKDDGWSAAEVDEFDAVWVKNNSYAQATYQTDSSGNVMLGEDRKPIILDNGDQEHRNKVTSRLIFESKKDASLYAGLDAIDTSNFNFEDVHSADYLAFEQKCIEKNKILGYEPQFKGQDPVQTYLSARAADDGEVSNNNELGELSAFNTLLFKQEKPADVQAQEGILRINAGKPGEIFEMTNPDAYAKLSELLENGAVEDIESIEDVYDSIEVKTASLKANAIMSGQIEFSDAEIIDTCIKLMHDRDRSLEDGSRGVGSETNNAEKYYTQIEQLILENPNLKEDLLEKIKDDKFEYNVYHRFQETSGALMSCDTKSEYLNLVSKSEQIVNEQKFLDENGNQITNKQDIILTTAENKIKLDEFREYVNQLERDFKAGVDAEGCLSDAANFLATEFNVGTDRGDVANEYREAKMLLTKMEAAAEGRLRDAEGNVITMEQLAEEAIQKEAELIKSQGAYDNTISTGKMVIVLAPVVAASGAASGLAATGAAALGLSSTMALGASSVASGVATGVITYGMETLEARTSYTGNTTAAKQKRAKDAVVDGVLSAVTFSIGAATEKINLGETKKIVEKALEQGIDVTTDTFLSTLSSYVKDGTVNEETVLYNLGISFASSMAGGSVGTKAHSKNSSKFVKNTTKEFTQSAIKDTANSYANLTSNSNSQINGTKYENYLSQIKTAGSVYTLKNIQVQLEKEPDSLEREYVKKQLETKFAEFEQNTMIVQNNNVLNNRFTSIPT